MSRYWNSSRPKFVNGEPQEHIDAKEKVAEIMKRQDYKQVIFEWVTPEIPYRSRMQPFAIDIKVYNRHTGHTILIQLDGGYHKAGKYVGKTKNRDESISEYCNSEGYGYAVLDVMDVLDADEKWIVSEIWKEIEKNKNKSDV